MLDFVQPYISRSAISSYEDNEGAKTMADNTKGSHHRKHINVRFHFLRGLVRVEQLEVHSVASAGKHADILTKPLGCEAFRTHRDFFTNLHEGV